MPTALELLDAQPAPAVLPTGLPGLDALLSGGLWCGEVAELCGGAPCGKSSVALAAAAAALLARASATVLLIATTQDRHGVRLRGLLAGTVGARLAAWRRQPAGGGGGGALAALLPRCAARRRAQGLEAEGALAGEAAAGRDQALAAEEVASACGALRVVHATDWARLQRVLAALERDALALAAPAAGEEEESGGGSASAASAATPYALFLAGLRLVIIDALPTVIYPVLGGQRNFVGHAALSEVGARLHRLARARCLAALVLNSAVAGRGGEEGGAGEPGWHPSLGTTWSFVPDLSILVTRQHLCVGAPAAAAGGQAAPPAAPAAAAALRDTLAFAVLKSSRLYLGQSSGAAWDLMPEVLML